MKTFFVIMIVLLILTVIAIAVAVSFFVYVFVRRKKRGLDDLSSKENRFLHGYKDTMQSGLDYIRTLNCTKVYAESYDGLRLSARFYPCENSQKAIILFHGYRSSALRDYSCAVKMYLNNGLNVLLVDQRSHGESRGRLITFGIKERYDVLTWIEFLLGKLGHDTAIFLSGISMGASTVMMATSLDLPSNVKGIVADCGFTSPAEIISLVAERDFHVSGKFSIKFLDVMCRLFGKFSLHDVSSDTALANSNLPVLFIHGDADKYVPCEMSIRNHDVAAGDKYLCIVKDAGHGCGYLVDPEKVSQALSEFFNRYS